MWLVSTFEKIYLKKIFFVSTFLDWYKIHTMSLKKLIIYCQFLNKFLNKLKCYVALSFKWDTEFEIIIIADS